MIPSTTLRAGPRPIQHLKLYGERYPTAWQQAEEMRLARGKTLPLWPDWCFLPLAGAYSIISGIRRIDSPEMGMDVSRLGALVAWRVTKGVYRFDADIFAELWATPVNGEIPTAVLERLPEWCVYVEIPPKPAQSVSEGEVLGGVLHGFYAHLEWDANTKRRELRLLLDYEAGLSPVAIHLGGTIKEGLDLMVAEGERVARTLGIDVEKVPGFDTQHNIDWARALAPLVSLLLYLCTETPDIAGSQGRPGNPQPTKTKRGLRLFAAAGLRIWEVAYRLGAVYRQARMAATLEGERGSERSENVFEAGSRHGPRPHIRAAHWHTYWTGKRSGPQTPVLKWLPPIPVAFDPNTELPAVVRRVKRWGASYLRREGEEAGSIKVYERLCGALVGAHHRHAIDTLLGPTHAATLHARADDRLVGAFDLS